MGFHLLNKVYANVRGTSPTAQAVLAYLAHRADDEGVRSCFPSVKNITEATHFGHSSVANALSDLRDAKLLDWTSGGRHKGTGGRALANTYRFHLPTAPGESSVHLVDNAASTRRIVHTPPRGQCSIHQVDTINHGQPRTSTIGQSPTPGTEAEDDDVRAVISGLGAQFRVNRQNDARASGEVVDGKKAFARMVVEKAMSVCGVSDDANRRIFSSTLMRRDKSKAIDLIFKFASEVKQGEHKGAHNLAAVLNDQLSRLPIDG